MPIFEETIHNNAHLITELSDLMRAPRPPDLRVDVGALRVTNPELESASIAQQTMRLTRAVSDLNLPSPIDLIDSEVPARKEYNSWARFLVDHNIDPLGDTRVAELHVAGLPLDQHPSRNMITGTLNQLTGWIAAYQATSGLLSYPPISVLRARTSTIGEHHLKRWGFTTFPSGLPNKTIKDRLDLIPGLARDPNLSTNLARTEELHRLLTKQVVVGLITPQEYLNIHHTTYSPDDNFLQTGSILLQIDVETTPNLAILRITQTDSESFPGQNDVVRCALFRLGARLPLAGFDTIVADNNNQSHTMEFARSIGTDIPPYPPLSDYVIAKTLNRLT